MTADDLKATGVAWDLSDLYASPDDPALRADLDRALTRAEAYAATYRRTIDVPGGPTPEHLARALGEYASILELADKPAHYASLLYSADARPAANGALVALTQEKETEIRNHLLFFELEWLALSEEVASALIESAACGPHRHHLVAGRRLKPHVLSEPEEIILHEKALTGDMAWARLFDALLSTLTFAVDIDGAKREMNESEVLALLHDPSRDVRRAAARGLTAGLQSNRLVITTVFNTVVQDHAVDVRLRRYPDAMAARHLTNEIEPGAVESLIAATERASGMVSDYYDLKRRLLGLETLYDYDRYAPLAHEEAQLTWTSCRDTVLAAYADFSPQMAEIASQFFTKRWIDAEARDGKRGGAFSSGTVPSVHPYVLVNYTGRARDVMTVAHELGHGVHQWLSRPQGYLQADTPLTMAETASVFGEMLVFDRLRRTTTDPALRLALLCQKLEDSFATVFRQIALTRFEQALHGARRSEGELSAERIGELWMDANRAMYGPSVILTDDYQWWWGYIPHFIHSPFYCYAYGFGELLVLTLYETWQREGDAFVPRYFELLAAGGSDSPTALLRRTGIDLDAPDFWDRGLRVLRGFVDQALELAARA